MWWDLTLLFLLFDSWKGCHCLSTCFSNIPLSASLHLSCLCRNISPLQNLARRNIIKGRNASIIFTKMTFIVKGYHASNIIVVTKRLYNDLRTFTLIWRTSMHFIWEKFPIVWAETSCVDTVRCSNKTITDW